MGGPLKQDLRGRIVKSSELSTWVLKELLPGQAVREGSSQVRCLQAPRGGPSLILEALKRGPRQSRAVEGVPGKIGCYGPNQDSRVTSSICLPHTERSRRKGKMQERGPRQQRRGKQAYRGSLRQSSYLQATPGEHLKRENAHCELIQMKSASKKPKNRKRRPSACQKHRNLSSRGNPLVLESWSFMP